MFVPFYYCFIELSPYLTNVTEVRVYHFTIIRTTYKDCDPYMISKLGILASQVVLPASVTSDIHGTIYIDYDIFVHFFICVITKSIFTPYQGFSYFNADSKITVGVL